MDITVFSDTLYKAVYLILTDYPVLPLYVFTFSLIYGIGCVFLNGSVERIGEGLKTYMAQTGEIDYLFKSVGSKYNTKRFTVLVCCTSSGIAIAGIMLFGLTGNIRLAAFCMAAAMGETACFWPREHIYGNTHSPVFIILNRKLKKKREKLDNELFGSVITLKNLAIIQEEEPLSGDTIIEKLMNSSDDLKPIYARVLSLYRQGNTEDAFRFFSSETGTKNGGTFALVLSKIDRINPNELKSQVESLLEIMNEERYTKGIIDAERKGNITFAMATIVCFIMSVNLVVTCVLIDALSSLGEIL